MAVPSASISASKLTLAPGEITRVTLVGSDADSRAVTLTGTVSDGEGTTAQATVVLQVADPLTYELASSDPAVIVTPVSPGVWDVRV